MSEDVCYNLVIDERPVAAWSPSLAEDNDRFLRGIHPEFFSDHLDEFTEAVIQKSDLTAALRLRLLYGHALETLFALVCAAVQAPHCAAAWVLSYRSDELRSVVGKITGGSLRYHRMPGPISWENVSNTINHVAIDDPEKDVWVRAGFASAWRRFAMEFVSDSFTDEQNGLKHGLRVVPGGFSFSLRSGADSKENDGDLALESNSEFGSRFFIRNRLDKHNFSLKESARNWNPTAMSAGLELLALSIGNAASYLRARGGVAGPDARFRWPVEPPEAFELPFQTDFLVQEISGGWVLESTDVELRSAEQILSTYDDPSDGDEGGV